MFCHFSQQKIAVISLIRVECFQIGKANHQAIGVGKINYSHARYSRLPDMKMNHLRVTEYKLLKYIFVR